MVRTLEWLLEIASTPYLLIVIAYCLEVDKMQRPPAVPLSPRTTPRGTLSTATAPLSARSMSPQGGRRTIKGSFSGELPGIGALSVQDLMKDAAEAPSSQTRSALENGVVDIVSQVDATLKEAEASASGALNNVLMNELNKYMLDLKAAKDNIRQLEGTVDKLRKEHVHLLATISHNDTKIEKLKKRAAIAVSLHSLDEADESGSAAASAGLASPSGSGPSVSELRFTLKTLRRQLTEVTGERDALLAMAARAAVPTPPPPAPATVDASVDTVAPVVQEQEVQAVAHVASASSSTTAVDASASTATEQTEPQEESAADEDEDAQSSDREYFLQALQSERGLVARLQSRIVDLTAERDEANAAADAAASDLQFAEQAAAAALAERKEELDRARKLRVLLAVQRKLRSREGVQLAVGGGHVCSVCGVQRTALVEAEPVPAVEVVPTVAAESDAALPLETDAAAPTEEADGSSSAVSGSAGPLAALEGPPGTDTDAEALPEEAEEVKPAVEHTEQQPASETVGNDGPAPPPPGLPAPPPPPPAAMLPPPPPPA